MTRVVAALLVAVALALTACGGGEQAVDEAAPALRDVRSVDQFKRLFNEDAGVPRLAVLVSPT